MSFPAYGSYRESGVEWLGQVPSHWEIIPIKGLSPVLRGASPRPIDDARYFDETGEFGWVRIADVSASDGVLRDTPQRLSELGASLSVKLPVGSLFVSIAGSVGKPCIAGVPCCIHDGFVYFPFLNITPKFLFRVFEAGTCYLGLGKMGTQLNLNTDTIGSIRIALPPRSEMDAILSFLDRETAKIDALVEAQRRLIELLKEKRQAVISHAVTKGLDPSAPMKDSGVEWLGHVPAHWEVKPLMHLTEPGRAIMYGIVLPGPDAGEGIPIVKGGDVKPHRLRLDLLARTTPEIEAPFARARLRPGDIVYSIRGSIGDAESVPEELLDANITQDAARISPRSEICKRWLLQVMRSSPVFVQLEQRSLGATIRGINIFDLKRARIPTPPREEQEQIAKFLDDKAADLDALAKAASMAITLLQERRAALISAAVTGKIDVRGLVKTAEAA